MERSLKQSKGPRLIQQSRQGNNISIQQMSAKASQSLPKFTDKLRFLQEHIRTSDIKDAIAHILKAEEQPYQYELMSAILANHSQKPVKMKIAFNDLDRLLDNIKTFETFLLIVKYLLRFQSKFSSMKITELLRYLGKKCSFYEKETQLMEEDSPDPKFVRIRQAVRIGVEVLPKLFQKLNKNLDTEHPSSFLNWVLVCPTETVQDCRAVRKFCHFLAKECYDAKSMRDVFDCKDTRKLLKLVIEKAAKRYEGAQNLFYIIESMNETILSSALSSSCTDFTSFPCQTYLKCFQALTKSSLGPQTLRFIILVSNALKEEYQFHILKQLYESFIIPKLVRYYKFCGPQQAELQSLVGFYVYGFMNRIHIQPSHVKYFLTDYRLLTKRQMSFWLEMAVILAYERPEVQKAVMLLIAEITPLKTLQEIYSQSSYDARKKEAWVFLDKDLMEKKKYKYSASQRAGITNEDVNCYMISSMQALFMSRTLPNILKAYSNYYCQREKNFFNDRQIIRLPLLYYLNFLFERLEQKSKHTSVTQVKKHGPQYFRDPMQQDCQHYLNELFESIEKQIKKIPDKRIQQEFQEKVKSAFQITISSDIKCKNCESKFQNIENTYNLSIDYKETLAEQWQSKIQGYLCDKCNKKGSQRCRYRIVKFPEILFLHIKRFHFDSQLGEMKRLEDANIPRVFQNYELQGFISHIGNKVLCGHYTIYYKDPDDPLKWILFDDRRVSEFRIDSENQHFESNLKSENTPYIIIYKRTKTRK